MHSLTRTEDHHAARSLTGVVAGLVIWALVNSQLTSFSAWVVAIAAIPPGTRLYDAVAFFAYDTPKILLLLTLIVFAMGVVLIRVPRYSNAAGIIPVVEALLGKGAAVGILTVGFLFNALFN